MNSFSHPAIVGYFGSPGSGKTYCMRYCVYKELKKGEIKQVHVFTGTPYDDEYGWADPDSIHGNPAEWEAYINALMATQIATPKSQREKILLIFDDWTGKMNWLAATYSKMVSDRRHLEFSIYIVCHYANKLPPLMREALTHAAIFEQVSHNSFDALYRSLGEAAFESYKAFRAWLCKVTNREKHIFVWFTRSPKNGEKIFQPLVCPENLPDFKVFNTERKDEEEDEGDEQPAKKKQKS